MFKSDDIIWDEIVPGSLKIIVKKKIKNCPGIAFQVRGQIVEAWHHPRFANGWQYYFKGETWLASDWAFEEDY